MNNDNGTKKTIDINLKHDSQFPSKNYHPTPCITKPCKYINKDIIPDYIHTISKMAQNIYECLFNNKIINTRECNFQNLFRKELMKHNIMVNCEVVRPILYNNYEQFSDGCFYREDMVIDNHKLVIENKRIKNITDKETIQLYKYLYQRSKYTEWGHDTHGLLINFGDNLFEIQYLFYDSNKQISCINLLSKTYKSIYNDICFYKLKND